jgi:hypothetical protein
VKEKGKEVGKGIDERREYVSWKVKKVGGKKRMGEQRKGGRKIWRCASRRET